MALYRYVVLLADGKQKASQVTAKSATAAREQVARMLSVVEWKSLEVVTEPAASPTKPAAAVPEKTPPAKSLKKLERVLFLQGGVCFYCRKPLQRERASIDHLLPLSLGGTRTPGNEVVCHASVNDIFGNMDLKSKLEVVLKKAGKFTCP